MIITVHVAPDGVYQRLPRAQASVLRGPSILPLGTIVHPRSAKSQKIYIPSPEDQPDLFFFAENEPLFTWTGEHKVAGSVTQSVKAFRFEIPEMEDYLRESGAAHPDLESLVAEAKADPEKRFAGDCTAPDGAVLGTGGTYSWIDGDLTIGGNNSVTLDGVLLVSGGGTPKST